VSPDDLLSPSRFHVRYFDQESGLVQEVFHERPGDEPGARDKDLFHNWSSFSI
jgi:hypothetical protein